MKAWIGLGPKVVHDGEAACSSVHNLVMVKLNLYEAVITPQIFSSHLIDWILSSK